MSVTVHLDMWKSSALTPSSYIPSVLLHHLLTSSTLSLMSHHGINRVEDVGASTRSKDTGTAPVWVMFVVIVIM